MVSAASSSSSIQRAHSMPLQLKQLQDKAKDFQNISVHVITQACFALCFREPSSSSFPVSSFKDNDFPSTSPVLIPPPSTPSCSGPRR